MAILSSKGQNITHMCSYYNVILRASREYTDYMWCYYDADYRQEAEATHSKDWFTIDTALFNLCFTGRARQFQHCNLAKQDSAACPCKLGKHPASNLDDPKQANQRLNQCLNFNYHDPCDYKHQSFKCCPVKHAFLKCPKWSGEDSKN